MTAKLDQSTIDDAKAELRARIQSYGENFGITRLHYETTGDGWWVRLGWSGKRSIYQASFLDSDYRGNTATALAAAVQDRNDAFEELWLAGVIAAKDFRPRPFLTKRNRYGVSSLARQRTPSRTGAGSFWSWKVNWHEAGKLKGRSFADSTYGGPLAAFRAAVNARVDVELRLYGYSVVDAERIEAVELELANPRVRRPAGTPASKIVLMRHIIKMDSEAFRGYRVFLCATQSQPEVERYFSVVNLGSWKDALAAAVAFRDREAALRRGSDWRQRTKFDPKPVAHCNSATGIVGVVVMELSTGWIAQSQWQVWDGDRRKTKRVMRSIAKYGRDAAIQLVKEAREHGIIEDQLETQRRIDAGRLNPDWRPQNEAHVRLPLT